MIKINKRKCREYANPDHKLNPSNDILHAKQVDYIITTSIKIIAHRRILILYINLREKARKGDCTPVWTMFHTKDDFLTLANKPDGSTAWRTASFDRLDDYYSNKQYAFYSAQDEKRVQRYFKTDTDADGFQTLSSAQNAILSRRCRERRIASESVVLSRMAGLQALPRGLNSWIKSIMPAYFFYDYKRGAKQVAGVCSACGHEVIIPNIKQGSKAVCPHCKHELTAKPRSRRGSNMYDRDTFEVIQNMGDGRLVIRIIKAYFTYKTDTPDVDIYENARQFIWQDADGKFCTESYYYGNRGILTSWKKGALPLSRMYQYYFEGDTCGYLYTKNLPEALSGTPWQYCTIADFSEHFLERMQALPFLREHLEHPKIEHLCKVGFYNIASDIVYKNTANCLDETQNRTHRILGVAAEDVDFLRIMDASLSTLAVFQRYSGFRDRKRLLVWQMENKIQHNILPILKCITIHKLIRYTTKQFQHLCQRKGQYGSLRYQKMQDVVTEYRDYLEMCRDLDYDMKNSFVLYPKDLQKAHDRVQKRIKIKENELIQKNFKDAMEAVADSRAFVSDGLKIVFPATPRDLETEGNALHHCVGRYVKSVEKKECIILFIRRCSDETKPFYTMEVQGQEIIQVRGINNTLPTPEIKKFLDAYRRQVLQKPVNSAA